MARWTSLLMESKNCSRNCCRNCEALAERSDAGRSYLAINFYFSVSEFYIRFDIFRIAWAIFDRSALHCAKTPRIGYSLSESPSRLIKQRVYHKVGRKK